MGALWCLAAAERLICILPCSAWCQRSHWKAQLLNWQQHGAVPVWTSISSQLVFCGRDIVSIWVIFISWAAHSAKCGSCIWHSAINHMPRICINQWPRHSNWCVRQWSRCLGFASGYASAVVVTSDRGDTVIKTRTATSGIYWIGSPTNNRNETHFNSALLEGIPPLHWLNWISISDPPHFNFRDPPLPPF